MMLAERKKFSYISARGVLQHLRSCASLLRTLATFDLVGSLDLATYRNSRSRGSGVGREVWPKCGSGGGRPRVMPHEGDSPVLAS